MCVNSLYTENTVSLPAQMFNSFLKLLYKLRVRSGSEYGKLIRILILNRERILYF